MLNADYHVRGELPEDSICLETLTETVFGPGMRARAAYYLREGVDHEMDLSFVVEVDKSIVGTVRLTKVVWGNKEVLMLGPLAVLPHLKGRGIGKLLMQTAVDAARTKSASNGPPAIILVGDLDYYKGFGFVPVVATRISLPRPADPRRVLACDLIGGCLDTMSGNVVRYGGN